MIKIATAALAAVMLLGGILGLSPAGAAATPVIDADVTGWTHMVRSPGSITIGQGGAPGVVHLAWQHWGTYAEGTGTLIIMHNPRCAPAYQCRYDRYSVRVWLHRVITHQGARVFSRMRWTYGRAGHLLQLRLAGGYWTP